MKKRQRGIWDAPEPQKGAHLWAIVFILLLLIVVFTRKALPGGM